MTYDGLLHVDKFEGSKTEVEILIYRIYRVTGVLPTLV